MFVRYSVSVPAAVLVLWTSVALADGIEPGLWKIITRIESGGVVGPPLQSAKCVTPDQARNVAKTFSPVAGTVNSECAPLERNFADGKLAWKLVCKGQLDMEVSGAFHFDSPRHYTAIVHTTATMAGAQVANSQNHLEAQWVSECQ